MQANQSRIDSIHDKGKQLINNEHYASDVIKKRLDELDELWKHLLDKTQEKGKIYFNVYNILQGKKSLNLVKGRF